MSGFLTGITTLLAVLFVLKFGNMKNVVHRVLILLNLSISLWGFCCMAVGLSRDPHTALIWWRVAHIGGFFSAVFLLHVILAVTGIKIRGLLPFAYMQGMVAEICLATGASRVKVKYVFDSYYHLVPDGIGYPISCFLWLALGVCSFIILYRVFRYSYGDRRTQLRYLLVALMFGYWGGSTHIITVANTNFFPYGNFVIFLLPTLITYAILKHKLLDIEVIVKKTLIFTGLLAAVFGILILPTLLIQEYLVRGRGTGGRLIGLSISGIIIVFTMRRIEAFLTDVTDRYLFQKKYSYKELLKAFSEEVLTVVDLGALVRLTVDKLVEIVRIESAAVFLFDDEKQKFIIAASHNLKDTHTTFRRADAVFANTGAGLIIPVKAQDEAVAIVTLGKKRSDEAYSQDDLDILLPLARTLAIAISNARLFDELGKVQAEAAQKEKMATIGTLAAGMAHEIRNPIMTIRTFADYLPERFADASFMATFRRLVPREIDRIDAIARSLLDFAQADHGTHGEAIDLGEAIRTVLLLLEPNFRFSEIATSCVVAEGARWQGSRVKFEEALFNILKYVFSETPRGGSVAIEARAEGREVSVAVKARDVTLIAGMREDIFEPASHAHRERRGFGFDLFIAKELIEKNGGVFDLRTPPEGGVEVVLTGPSPEKGP